MKRLYSLLLVITLTFPLVNAHTSEKMEADGSDELTLEFMRFAGNIHQFNTVYPQEKVFLQFDNTSYYTGEVIWFKAFVVNATTHERAQSKVLYVDLISPTGVLLTRQKLKIVAGQADGAFPLLDGSTAQAREKRGVLEYPSGFYEIRAYTSYMLNFNVESIFSRVFAVYEKPKKEGNYYAENPTVTLRKVESYEPRPKTEKLNRINCEFYPEGGHLIMGKTNRVAFKVTGNTGFGIEAQGVLDDTDITFVTVHDGMGSFIITPQKRKNTVTLTVDGKKHSFSLPQPEQAGLAIQVSQCLNDSISLIVDCSLEFMDKVFGMIITCRGDIVDFRTVRMESDRIETVISMAGIPEGVCRISLFDNSGNLFASRAVYHRSPDLKTPLLEVQSDKENYDPFEKVNLRFQLKDGQGNPFRDRFCLSVRDSRSQGNILADDLRTSMLLSSDLKGFIENPSWYFDSDDAERETALDLLMLVQGWERYDWQTMTGQKEFRERHRLEESLTLNGWVMNTSGKEPIEGIEVLAALMPTDKRLSETYTYKTDSSGYFGFDIGTEFYDKARFTIDAHVSKRRLVGPTARVVFDRSMTPAIRAYQPQELVFTGLQSASRSSDGKTGDIEDDGLPTVIKNNTGLLLPEVDIDEERMYVDYFTFTAYDVAKDVELELDKGEYSTDLQGYLLEKGYVINPEYRVKVIRDKEGHEKIKDSTVFTINGFEPFFYVHDSQRYRYTGVFDEDTLARFAIDTKDIKSIAVFDRPMFVRDILLQCPLFVDSPRYKGFMDSLFKTLNIDSALFVRKILVDVLVKEGSELSTRNERFKINKRVTTVDGYSRPYEFYAPEYPDGPVLGDVDYRRTLYWNPNVITDSNGQVNVEFYNNSFTKHFNVSAAGITASGIPYILNQNW